MNKMTRPQDIMLPTVTTGPIQGSHKIYDAPAGHQDVRVPFREIVLQPEANEPPFRVYDPSGPYTDADAKIDVEQGLVRHRAAWIAARGGVEAYDGRDVQPEDNGNVTGKALARDFPNKPKPFRGVGSAPVTQLEFARAGIVTKEMIYIAHRENLGRTEALAKCFSADLPCLLVTGGADIAKEVVLEGERAGVPILRTSVPTAAAIGKLTAVLEDRLATREIIHGVLIDILGLGVLIVGESGIGKSECALDLVVRGHRLVADDAVEVRRRSESIVIGACPERTRNHMEVRGIGLINIRDLFGVASTRASKRIELVVQLDRWDSNREYDRLGLDEPSYELMGLKVPLIRMPVATGRNLAILVEVAARNQLLRMRGINAARELVARLDARLEPAAPPAVPHSREGGDDDDDMEPGSLA